MLFLTSPLLFRLAICHLLFLTFPHSSSSLLFAIPNFSPLLFWPAICYLLFLTSPLLFRLAICHLLFAIPNFSSPPKWYFSLIPPFHPCFPGTFVLLIKLHTETWFYYGAPMTGSTLPSLAAKPAVFLISPRKSQSRKQSLCCKPGNKPGNDQNDPKQTEIAHTKYAEASAF